MLGGFHFSGVFWFRFPYWAMSWLDGRPFDVAVFVFAALFHLALGPVRRAIAANLEAVLGPAGFWERQRRAFRTLRTFAYCLGERYEYLRHPERFEVEVEGADHLQAAADSGRGLIFVTAHVGSWEIASKGIPSGLRRETHVVREEELDAGSQAFVEQVLRSHAGTSYTTHFASDDPRLGVELVRALRSGHVVALQGDRPRAGGQTAPATLFGRPVALPVGPAVLARAAGAPLLPVFSFREDRHRYRVVLSEPIRVASEGPRSEAVEETVRRFAAEIERAIRRAPYQWFCLRRLWD